MPWSQDLLIDAARKDPDAGVRSAAIRALDPTIAENRDVLKEALGSDEDAQRLAAAQALGASKSSVDLTWAAHLLALPATREGLAFATALLRNDQDEGDAAVYLQEALHDPSPTMRHAVLVALTGTSTSVDGLDDLASDPSDQVRVAWCRLTRKLGTSKAKKRLAILEPIVGGKEAGRDALVALAEEKGGYVKARAQVWWLLRDGSPDAQRYVLAHAARPFEDPALAIWGMKAKDPEVRLQAAAAWLARK
jgi:HEAT repeat protein